MHAETTHDFHSLSKLLSSILIIKCVFFKEAYIDHYGICIIIVVIIIIVWSLCAETKLWPITVLAFATTGLAKLLILVLYITRI